LPAPTGGEQVLAGFVPLALGFVADFIGLGGLTTAVREQLAKVRKVVEAVIDRLLAKVLQLVGRLGAGGKQFAGQAVDAVKGFFGIRTKFEAGSERHSLYFAQRNGRSVLIIESTPTEINEFLDHLQQHYPKAAAKTAEIAAIRDHLDTYTPIYQQLAISGLPDARQQVYHRQLLRKNVELSERLKSLLGSADHPSVDDKGNPSNLIEDENRYKLEGTTGIYAHSLKTTKDYFTFDHQPQAFVLTIASDLQFPASHALAGQRLFDGYPAMTDRAADDALKGYAILLSEVRHEHGRTYLGKGKTTGLIFRNLTKFIMADTNTSDDEKREKVVELLKDELRQDAQMMINLMQGALSNGTFTESFWSDIDGGWKPRRRGTSPVAGVQKEFPSGDPADNDYRKAIKKRITHRIIQGEKELLAQPMDQLKRK
jgi:hypothetical protein